MNIILVRYPFRSSRQKDLFNKYKDSLLFIGISSFEDFPLPPPNPFSAKFPANTYVGLFPGFLHMEKEPEKVFPPHVKLLLLSQSDFALPAKGPAMPKKYDFTFSGSDQDVHRDCVGWSSFAKNWTFAKEALEVMCSQGITGVLVATKDKQGRKACSIPANCAGKITQTTFLSQEEFFKYVRQSKFLFVPQVHDASPRVTTQAGWLQLCLFDPCCWRTSSKMRRAERLIFADGFDKSDRSDRGFRGLLDHVHVADCHWTCAAGPGP